MPPAAAVTHLVDRKRDVSLRHGGARRGHYLQPASFAVNSRPKSPRSLPRSAPRVWTLDHCNAHKHFHLHPVVGRMMAEIGLRFGLRAGRIPLEPAGVLRLVEGPRMPWAAAMTTPFALFLLRRRCRAAGLLVPDHVFLAAVAGTNDPGAPLVDSFAICRTASTKSMFILPSANLSKPPPAITSSRRVRRAHGSRHCRGLPQFFAEAGWIRGFCRFRGR